MLAFNKPPKVKREWTIIEMRLSNVHPSTILSRFKRVEFFFQFQEQQCMRGYPGLVVQSSKFITTYWSKFSFLHNQFHLIQNHIMHGCSSQNMLVWLSKMVLAQHFFHRMLKLAKGTTKPNSYCWLARIWFDWSKWVSISRPSPFGVLKRLVGLLLPLASLSCRDSLQRKVTRLFLLLQRS
jgi:hypothetical protein